MSFGSGDAAGFSNINDFTFKLNSSNNTALFANQVGVGNRYTFTITRGSTGGVAGDASTPDGNTYVIVESEQGLGTEIVTVTSGDFSISKIGNNNNNTKVFADDLVGVFSVGTRHSWDFDQPDTATEVPDTGTANEPLSFGSFVLDTDVEWVTEAAANVPPTSNAGSDRNNIQSGEAGVALTGAATDSDGTVASTVWTQVSGTTVTINNSTTLNASYNAPTITSSEDLVFRLTVTDDDGDITTDDVTHTVLAPNVDVTQRYFTSFTAIASVPSFTLESDDVLKFTAAIRTTDNFHTVISNNNTADQIQIRNTTSASPQLRLFLVGVTVQAIDLGTNYAHGCFNDFELTVNNAATEISVDCNGVTVGTFDISGATTAPAYNSIGGADRHYFADVVLIKSAVEVFNFAVTETGGTTLVDSVAGNNGTFGTEPEYRAQFDRDDTKALFPNGVWKDSDQGAEIPEFASSLHGYPISSNIAFSLWLSYGQSLSVGFTDPSFQHLYSYLTPGGYSLATQRYFMNQDKKGHVHSMIRQASIDNANKSFLCDTYGNPSQSIQDLSKGAGTGYYEALIAGAQAKFDSLRAGDSISEIVIDWTQGTANRVNPADYNVAFGQLRADITADIQAIINVPIRFIHTQQGTANAFEDTDSLEVALAHYEASITAFSGTTSQLACPLWYILRQHNNGDNVHANPLGYAKKGEYKSYAYSNPSFNGLTPNTAISDITGGSNIASVAMNVETLPLRSITDSFMPQDAHKGVLIIKSDDSIVTPTSVTFSDVNVVVESANPFEVGDKIRFGDYSDTLPYVNILDSTEFTGESTGETLSHAAFISEIAVTVEPTPTPTPTSAAIDINISEPVFSIFASNSATVYYYSKGTQVRLF